MFQFPRFPPRHKCRSDYSSSSQVSLFGHPRIKACLQLPVAYRSLPRPSSTSRAKAFPIRPYLLPTLLFLRISKYARLDYITTIPTCQRTSQDLCTVFRSQIRLYPSTGRTRSNCHHIRFRTGSRPLSGLLPLSCVYQKNLSPNHDMQLLYVLILMVENIGLEPMTPRMQI